MRPALVLSIVLWAGIGSKAMGAGEARFWLSTVGSMTMGPEAATVELGLTQSPRMVYLWAQPMAGKTLRNVSLNIIDLSADPKVNLDQSGESIVLENPTFNNGINQKFQYVNDSSTELTATAANHEIRNLQAFTIQLSDAGISHVGMGPACGPGDPTCFATDGGPAWRLASFDIQATGAGAGTSELYLQLGTAGITHESSGQPEPSSSSRVLFGAGTTPVYTGAADDREMTKAGDVADLVIRVAAGPVAGDLNGDGLVNFGDLTPFTKALTTGYAAMFPTLDRVSRCDVSDDGKCNFGDLTPFALLLAGGPSTGAAVASVPESTSSMLALTGLLMFGCMRPALGRP